MMYLVVQLPQALKETRPIVLEQWSVNLLEALLIWMVAVAVDGV